MQKLFSYVMNNYWTTNYRHDQEGPVFFRYSIAPHGRFDAGAAARFGMEKSQPLLAVPVDECAPLLPSFLHVSPAGVVVTALKPITEQDAWLVRLFGASGRPEQGRLSWGDGAPRRLWRSDLDGEAVERVAGHIGVRPFEMVTMRLDRAPNSVFPFP